MPRICSFRFLAYVFREESLVTAKCECFYFGIWELGKGMIWDALFAVGAGEEDECRSRGGGE